MTKEEIMKNRVLDKDTVETVQYGYKVEHKPEKEINWDDEDAYEQMQAQRQREYISPEAVQTMAPEEVFHYLLQGDPGALLDSTPEEGFLKLLSQATGRTVEELKGAIFGTGEFDKYKYYEPTPIQRRLIRYFTWLYIRLGNPTAIKLSEWPKECIDAGMEIIKDIPEEKRTEEYENALEYVNYYTARKDFPHWVIEDEKEGE